ncbi:nuclear transport factor 2 family protein [Daejeonella sp.]|uniref:YybH family protein n=1 Tax=Daejeonella sp. TaxID=2805397 RepID=UPI0025C3FB99|nr:nuclear transport factor 2 family protein [Daejeonella sp.]
MKKIILSLLFVFPTLCLVAQTTDKALILKLLEDQRLAWNQGDVEEYMQGYVKSDSLLYVGKAGPKYGWNNTLNNYKKSYPDKQAMGYLSFDIKDIKILSPDHAFVLGAWKLKREKDEPGGYFTLIVKKINGEWKVISDHSS